MNMFACNRIDMSRHATNICPFAIGEHESKCPDGSMCQLAQEWKQLVYSISPDAILDGRPEYDENEAWEEDF